MHLHEEMGTHSHLHEEMGMRSISSFIFTSSQLI